MKRFVLRASGFIVLLSTILVLGIWIPAYGVNDFHLFALTDKIHRLKTLPSPKLVLLGGSSCAFAYESRILEDSLRLPVVNMGVHIGFGMKYFLDQVRDDVHEEDIIVLMLEYDHLIDNASQLFWGGPVLAPVVVDIDEDAVKDLDLHQGWTIFKSFWHYSANKWVGLVEKPVLWAVRYEAMQKAIRGLYGRGAYNAYGDVRAELIGGGGVPPIEPGSFPAEALLPEAVDYLTAFDRFVQSRGARFFVTYPAMQRTALGRIVATAERIDSTLRAQGVTVIGRPSDFAVEEHELFDTVYHPTARTRERRTRQFVPLLKQQLSP